LLGRLREHYEKALQPIGEALAKLGVSPNYVTVIGLVIATASGYAFYEGRLLEGVALMALSGVADMIDGALARALGKASRFGEVLDRMVDRYAEFAILLGITASGYINWFWGFFTIFGMIAASYSRAVAEAVGGRGVCSRGVMERQEKLLMIAIGALLAISYPIALEVSVIIVGVLSHLTAIQRLFYAYRGLA